MMAMSWMTLYPRSRMRGRVSLVNSLYVPTRYSLVGSIVHLPASGSSEPARFETTIDKVAHLIEGHQVAGHGLCPASVYIEMASAAAQLLFEHHGRVSDDSTISLSEITFSNPLVYAPDESLWLVFRRILAEFALQHLNPFLLDVGMDRTLFLI